MAASDEVDWIDFLWCKRSSSFEKTFHFSVEINSWNLRNSEVIRISRFG